MVEPHIVGKTKNQVGSRGDEITERGTIRSVCQYCIKEQVGGELEINLSNLESMTTKGERLFVVLVG